MKRSKEIIGVGILAAAGVALYLQREFCPSKEVTNPRNETRTAVSAVSDGGVGDSGLRVSFSRDSVVINGLQHTENVREPVEVSGNAEDGESDELSEKRAAQKEAARAGIEEVVANLSKIKGYSQKLSDFVDRGGWSSLSWDDAGKRTRDEMEMLFDNPNLVYVEKVYDYRDEDDPLKKPSVLVFHPSSKGGGGDKFDGNYSINLSSSSDYAEENSLLYVNPTLGGSIIFPSDFHRFEVYINSHDAHHVLNAILPILRSHHEELYAKVDRLRAGRDLTLNTNLAEASQDEKHHFERQIDAEIHAVHESHKKAAGEEILARITGFAHIRR